MSSRNNLTSTTEFIIRRQKTRRMRTWQKLLIAIAIVICAVVVMGLGVFSYFKYIHRPVSGLSSPEQDLISVSGSGDNGLSSESALYSKKETKYNFLVVGCDRQKWLSDVIMIATYDVKEGSVAIMQIPRDTYVMVNKKLLLDENGNISHENFDGKNDYSCKINSVLGHGGKFAENELARIAKLASDADLTEIKKICKESFLDITDMQLASYVALDDKDDRKEFEYDVKLKFAIRYLSALIARDFGTPVDFYAHMNLDGFVNIVDAIGGVDVYVQEDMDYDDPYQDLHIHIKKGQRHLNGKDAEGFIRFRYGYAAADLARGDAQKIFMTAFIKKIMSLEGILNIDSLLDEIGDNLFTNITVSDAMYFATNALDVDLTKIVMLTLPGSAQYKNNVSYFLTDKETLMEYVNTYLNKYNEPLTEEHFYIPDLKVANQITPPMTAEEITENQPDLGFLY